LKVLQRVLLHHSVAKNGSVTVIVVGLAGRGRARLLLLLTLALVDRVLAEELSSGEHACHLRYFDHLLQPVLKRAHHLVGVHFGACSVVLGGQVGQGHVSIFEVYLSFLNKLVQLLEVSVTLEAVNVDSLSNNVRVHPSQRLDGFFVLILGLADELRVACEAEVYLVVNLGHTVLYLVGVVVDGNARIALGQIDL